MVNEHSISFHNICILRNIFYYDRNYWNSARYNKFSFTTPTLDNLTGIAEGNTTSSNSTSTSDSSEESGDN